MCKVQGTEDEVNTGGRGAAVPKKRQRLERRKGYLVRGDTYLLVEGMLKVTEAKGTAFSLETRHGHMLVELSRRETLRVPAKFVRECVVVKRRHVYDGDTLT